MTVVTKTKVINAMVFGGSTTDPAQQAMRDALIGFMAATVQAQAKATKEAQKAGIVHAKDREDAYRRRKPSFDRAQLDVVTAGLERGASVSTIAAEARLTR